MGIEIIDTLALANREKKRTVVMNTRRFHAWVHYYPNPGDRDDMHCHNADQSFYVISGECTMHFPDGTKATLTPGKAAVFSGMVGVTFFGLLFTPVFYVVCRWIAGIGR